MCKIRLFIKHPPRRKVRLPFQLSRKSHKSQINETSKAIPFRTVGLRPDEDFCRNKIRNLWQLGWETAKRSDHHFCTTFGGRILHISFRGVIPWPQRKLSSFWITEMWRKGRGLASLCSVGRPALWFSKASEREQRFTALDCKNQS